jgi:hypothetical protein
VHPDFKIVAAAENILAETIHLARLGERPVQDLRPFDKLAANVNVGELNIVRVARDDHALDELVRVFVNDLAILERARLRFIGIANEVNRLAALAVDKGPLQPAGKTRAAAATQARDFDVFADLLGT